MTSKHIEHCKYESFLLCTKHTYSQRLREREEGKVRRRGARDAERGKGPPRIGMM